MTASPRSAAAVVVAVGALSLTGCSGVTDALSNQAQGTYATVADAEEGWATEAPFPAWLPADSRNIRTVVSTNAALADLRVDTAGALPDRCTEVDRLTYSTYKAEWAPKTVLPDRVQQCGDWAVIPVPGGWYGWTPAVPATSAPSPSAG